MKNRSILKVVVMVVSGATFLSARAQVSYAPGVSNPCLEQATAWMIGGNHILGAQGLDRDQYVELGTCNDFPLILKANNHQALTVRQSGDVGIGTTNPAALLHLVKPASESKLFTESFSGFPASMWVLNPAASYGLRLDANGTGHIALNESNPLDFLNFTYNPSFNKAQVWVGSMKPDASSVHGNFDFAVNGKVVARELYIRITDWADFVFDENYNLPKLSDVEEYYKINKHLPGIPSAKTVSEEGIEVATIEKLLLQKVEELTLYLVDQQKEIEQLRAIVEKNGQKSQ